MAALVCGLKILVGSNELAWCDRQPAKLCVSSRVVPKSSPQDVDNREENKPERWVSEPSCQGLHSDLR